MGCGGSEGLKRRNTQASDRGGPVKYSPMVKLVFSTRKYNSNFSGVKYQIFHTFACFRPVLYIGDLGTVTWLSNLSKIYGITGFTEVTSPTAIEAVTADGSYIREIAGDEHGLVTRSRIC